MIDGEFDFVAPTALPEVLDLLHEHGARAKLLAGGMTLVPLMTLGLSHPGIVISLNHIPGLDGIEIVSGALRIGALVRHDALSRHALVRRHAPLLAQAAAAIGDVQVRNRGTLGGSLAHADPAADYLCAIAATGGQCRVRRHGGERVVEAGDFFQDVMTTVLAPDELLTAIEVPLPADGSGAAHLRLRRVEGAFPIVVASAMVAPAWASGRVGLGGVGPRPVALEVTDLINGGPTDAALLAIGERAYAAAAGAFDDLNGSAGYRQEMARVYARRAVAAAARNMTADGGAGV